MARRFSSSLSRILAMSGGAAHQTHYARMPRAPINNDPCAGLSSSITVQANPATQAILKPRYSLLFT